nr:hypothetical protein CFP56_19498 [Quercus suber]
MMMHDPFLVIGGPMQAARPVCPDVPHPLWWLDHLSQGSMAWLADQRVDPRHYGGDELRTRWENPFSIDIHRADHLSMRHAAISRCTDTNVDQVRTEPVRYTDSCYRCSPRNAHTSTVDSGVLVSSSLLDRHHNPARQVLLSNKGACSVRGFSQWTRHLDISGTDRLVSRSDAARDNPTWKVPCWCLSGVINMVQLQLYPVHTVADAGAPLGKGSFYIKITAQIQTSRSNDAIDLPELSSRVHRGPMSAVWRGEMCAIYLSVGRSSGKD